jgi:hypothetical protein
MAAATYTTNLADIFTDGTTTGWSALGGGASGLNQETDYFIQNTSCLSKNAFASATKGMIYDYGSDTGGTGTDGAFLAWITHTAPNSLGLKSAGGMQFLIGSASGDYEQYYVGGSDTMTFLGWELCAVSETVAGDTSTGTPSATVEQFFGALWNLPSGGPTKGAPNAIDAIRFGRCDAIFEFGDATPNGPATIAGCIATLDSVANRYGLLTQRKPGAAIENSGLVLFGTATNAVYLKDTNKTIVLRTHDHVTTNFHTWEVRNASSVVNIENFNVSSTGGASIGRWLATDDADVNLTGCTWVDMGTFTYLTNTTVLSNTWRRCGLITQGGATITSCFIDNSTATSAMLVDALGLVTKCHFVSDGTGHAVNLGTIAATASVDWDNTTSGYAGTDGSTGNETILVSVNSGQTLTINVASTATLPTIKNDGTGTVTVVTGQITVAVTVLSNTTGLPIADARVQLYDTADYTTVIMSEDCNASGVASISMSYTADIDVEGWVREMNVSGTDYVPADISGTITSAGFSLTVRLTPLD